MKEKEPKLKLSDEEKQALRLWCMDRRTDLPIQLYNWLIKSESPSDLWLRKTCYLSRRTLGSVIEIYDWVRIGKIPTHIINQPDYPPLDSDPL